MAVPMPGVAETILAGIHIMTFGMDFKLVIMLYIHNINLTHRNWNTSINVPEMG